jgi:uncharacterized protein YdhG (YjbR/CyaY superfamily)
MSNWINCSLDILASSQEEIMRIGAALRQPGEELLAWIAQKSGRAPEEVAANVKAIVSFNPKSNAGYKHPSVDTESQFWNQFKDRFSGIVFSHVYGISSDFPGAIFLAEYWNGQISFAGRRVIRAGKEVCSSYDGNQRAQGYEWVLPDIFAPYRTEYELGLKFGSLRGQWLSEMQAELADLKAFYGAPEAGVE